MENRREKHLMKLKGLRVQNGYTQKEFASLIGISHASYVQKELGNTDFNSSQMLRIADILKVEAGDLFFG
jgi:DNA-binding XRE family transcriptional regulator